MLQRFGVSVDFDSKAADQRGRFADAVRGPERRKATLAAAGIANASAAPLARDRQTSQTQCGAQTLQLGDPPVEIARAERRAALRPGRASGAGNAARASLACKTTGTRYTARASLACKTTGTRYTARATLTCKTTGTRYTARATLTCKTAGTRYTARASLTCETTGTRYTARASLTCETTGAGSAGTSHAALACKTAGTSAAVVTRRATQATSVPCTAAQAELRRFESDGIEAGR